jgi:hypothetical protein
MRRRRTALQTFGTAAALAVVIGVGSVLGGHTPGTSPSPAPATEQPRPAGGWLRSIPTEFPLRAGLPVVTGRDADHGTISDPTSPWTDRVACRPIDTHDRADGSLAFATDTRLHESRELALFADEAAAQAEFESLRQGAADCPDRPYLGVSTVGRFSVTPVDHGVLLQLLSYDGRQRVPGRQAAVLSQVGNAVLMVFLRDDSTAVESGHSTDQRLRDLLARSRALTAEMCVFSAAGCTTDTPSDVPSPAPAPRPAPVTTIPAELSLTAGLPAVDADTERTTTRDRSTQLAFDPCHNEGGHLTGPSRTDFLGVVQTYPAGARVRHLAVYADAATAAEAIDTLESELRLCRRYDYPDGTSQDRWVQLGSDAASLGVDEALVAVNHGYTDGNRTTLATHHLVVRVGNAVLVMAYDGEFGATDSGVLTVDAKQRDDAARIIPQLCVFADSGCTGRGTADSRSTAITFGPTGVAGVQLGASIFEEPTASRMSIVRAQPCAGFAIDALPAQEDGSPDGWADPDGKVVRLLARPGMTTPEGIGIGSSWAQVKAAYAHLVGDPSMTTAPVSDTAQYAFSARDGKVASLALEDSDWQGC